MKVITNFNWVDLGFLIEFLTNQCHNSTTIQRYGLRLVINFNRSIYQLDVLRLRPQIFMTPLHHLFMTPLRHLSINRISQNNTLSCNNLTYMRLGETRYDDLADISKALALTPKSLYVIRTVSSSGDSYFDWLNWAE